MQHKDLKSHTPPHPRPASYITQYFEGLIQLSNQKPVLMRNILCAVDVSSLVLLAGSVYHAVSSNNFWSSMAGAAAGTVGVVASSASLFAQQRFYGVPQNREDNFFKNTELRYESALAQIIVNENSMPTLKITAGTHYDAGYTEGYILGAAIKDMLSHTDFLYPLMRLKLGAPKDKAELKRHMDEIKSTIPTIYLEEIKGKVDGYNAWLDENYPGEGELYYHHYLLLQLLPDLRNYNPFPETQFVKRIMGLLGSVSDSLLPQMACTSVAMRLGDYTFFLRILDWPSYNVADKYFMQVDRSIGGVARTVDIGTPLLSGALTVLNTQGMLIEMNVAHGKQIDNPKGMPATLFNRFCAENATTVKQVEQLIDEIGGPVGAYHLTATDGLEAKSFHFYQCSDVEDNHAVDELNTDKETPQLMVVANHGLVRKDGEPQAVNHRDSVEREANIHHLFSQTWKQGGFDKYLGGNELSGQDIMDFKQFCLQVARLPLVRNCESVLCALYVYHKNELVDVSAATANSYAQDTPLEEFKGLAIPRM